MPAPFRARRWTRAEYERLVDLGVLRPDEPLELLDGELLVREPQSSRHLTAVALAARALEAAFGPGWTVRQRGPIARDERSVPEPDVAVVPRELRDHRDQHPARPVLAVEVADAATRELDRGRKAGLYARAELPEYWVVDLAGRVVEVHREPVPDETGPPGARYRSVIRAGPGDRLSPCAAPHPCIPVADLLP
jgi:Uma2 family endonuclease